MVVLSVTTGGRPRQDTRSQAGLIQGVDLHSAHQGATGHGAFGRVAVAASLGFCFLSGMAAPADASRHHNAEGKPEARKPEAPKQPTGPLLVAISIGGQRVTVYDNGTPIASSQISTGMSGHPTPTGIFSVIQKQRWHRSNLYSNAPMPFMQRITWSGVALHAGVVPGYPASHGCIRLPERFAVRLYGLTRLGARVIITRGEAAAPYEIDHPRLAGLVKPPEAAAPNSATKPDDAKQESAGISPGAVVVAATGAVSAGEPGRVESEQGAPAAPQDAADAGKEEPTTTEMPAPNAAPAPAAKGDDVLKRPGQLSLFVSRREGKLFVRKGFMPVFDVPVTITQPEKPLGTHIFTASRPANDSPGLRWLAVSLGYDRAPATAGSGHSKRKGRAERPVTSESPRQSAANALDRIELPAEALARLIPLVTPGTSLMISDQGLGGETGQETDFIVVTK